MGGAGAVGLGIGGRAAAPADGAGQQAEDESSALSDFLDHARVHERIGSVIPRELLRFGLYGSLMLIATGFAGLALPSPQAIEHLWFFVVFGGAAARMLSVMHSAAIPALAAGGGLLVLDVYLKRVPTRGRWRAVVVAQAVAGVAGAAASAALLALAFVNLVLWMIPIGFILGAMGVLRGGRRPARPGRRGVSPEVVNAVLELDQAEGTVVHIVVVRDRR